MGKRKFFNGARRKERYKRKRQVLEYMYNVRIHYILGRKKKERDVQSKKRDR